MKSQELKKIKIPDNPGVYFFYKENKILYIGKATSLKDRVRSYFSSDLIKARGPMILDMVTLSTHITWQETDSVLEALILEANLIKKYQPKYNTKEKDNKSFNYVCVTKEEIYRVLIKRERNIDKKKYKVIFGPFPNGSQLKEAMKITRRLFPYIDEQSSKKNNYEFYRQLGLVPETKVITQKNAFEKVLGRGGREPGPDHFQKYFSASLKEYKGNIKNLILFFQGKKKKIISDLKKEMMTLAKKKEFEKAGEIKKKIFALEHINDIALIKNSADDNAFKNRLSLPLASLGAHAHTYDFSKHIISSISRLEAYDIAHMSGKNMVGVMTVIENGEVNKSEYRKFIIKTKNKADDTGTLEEILSRRFNHLEWDLPNLIVVDGGQAQLNAGRKILESIKKKYLSASIDIVSVVKDDRHKAKAIIGNEDIIKKYKREILLANSEAHRFAITFHKKRRDKNFIS